jgi:hypothetical protein
MSDRGGAFDPETVLGPGSYSAAAHASGAACAMVEALLAVEARAGFCATSAARFALRERADAFFLGVLAGA